MELPGPQARVASRAPEKQEEGLRGGVRLKVTRLNPSPGRAPGRRLAETPGSGMELKKELEHSEHAYGFGLETGHRSCSGQMDSPQGRDAAVPSASDGHIQPDQVPRLQECDMFHGPACPVSPEADLWAQKQPC